MPNPTNLGDIAVVGLAVMGQNLVLNMNDHGFTVVAYNRTTSKVDEFLAGPAAGTKIVGAYSIEDMISKLKRPRKIMLMVKAGAIVDDFISQIIPFLEEGDIVIDGGNSLYTDSNRRTADLAKSGIYFIGTGVSGGEEGARRGPSIMPGGNPEAWTAVSEIFQAISAKAPDGLPCCDWVGEGGAGHYVKMVHNGIEYGDMQLICEAYHIMRDGLGMTAPEISKIFAAWNTTELDSYLVEITRDILAFKDTDGTPLVDKILDAAGQKGTGKWTAINALDLGMPVTLIGEAVFSRCLSSLKEDRVKAAKILGDRKKAIEVEDRAQFIDDIRLALLASKLVSYAQGYMLMSQAAKDYNWNLNYGAIANMWRGGCIIRSVFLGKIKEAYDKNPQLENLLLDSYFQGLIDKCETSWRKVVSSAVVAGIPLPAFSSALAFFDGYCSANLPANLLQAQRDYFGAHTYERTDRPRGEFQHTNWTGRGGVTSASNYTA